MAMVDVSRRTRSRRSDRRTEFSDTRAKVESLRKFTHLSILMPFRSIFMKIMDFDDCRDKAPEPHDRNAMKTVEDHGKFLKHVILFGYRTQPLIIMFLTK